MKKLKRNSAINYDLNSNVIEISVLSECAKEFKKECKYRQLYVQKDSIISIRMTPEYTIFLIEKENREAVLYSLKYLYETYIEKFKKSVGKNFK